MSKLIIIAGPQSSGKTTTLNYLKKKHKDWYFVDEVNPRTITGKKNFGAVNTNADLEERILNGDIDNIEKIDRKKDTVILESGIFHYVYARYFLYKKLADRYFGEYLQAHQGLKPYVFFIKTDLEVCFERRKSMYLKRILEKGVNDKTIIDKHLNEYKKIMEAIYPFWFDCYKKVPFPKISIENSYKAKNDYLKEAEEIIKSLLSQKSP
ncbi:AAA family ATPase [Candidatus Roizmanbacteria bacterium]|nr:AAA family ATPase [Candidatus Roizmanbacteria bacterium]